MNMLSKCTVYSCTTMYHLYWCTTCTRALLVHCFVISCTARAPLRTLVHHSYSCTNLVHHSYSRTTRSCGPFGTCALLRNLVHYSCYVLSCTHLVHHSYSCSNLVHHSYSCATHSREPLRTRAPLHNLVYYSCTTTYSRAPLVLVHYSCTATYSRAPVLCTTRAPLCTLVHHSSTLVHHSSTLVHHSHAPLM